ncbi:HNH endonuclease [Escherichia coli]
MRNSAEKFKYVTENYYLDDGIVYSKATHEVVPFTGAGAHGHRKTAIKVNGKRLALYAHDAVFMLHHNRPLPDGAFVVHHVDFNELNNAPGNLVLMSKRMHSIYHHYIAGDKCYCYRADANHHLKPWYALVSLPIGRRIGRYFATESEAAAFVEYHRAPIIKAFKQLGLPV